VAQLSALLKRSILDEVWNAASDTLTLEDAIRAFKSARWADVQAGRLILSTSGGGYSVSFAGAEAYSRIAPDLFLELGQEFLEIRTDTIATLTAAGSATDDEAVFATMLTDERLWGMNQIRPDFSCFNSGGVS